MSNEKPWYVAEEKSPGLATWIFTQMSMGAVYAFFFCMAIFFAFAILRAVAGLLPEDPNAMIETGSRLVQAIV